MNKAVSIIEIPTNDFERAKNFYQKILGISIEVVQMEGISFGIFPDTGGIVIQLIKSPGYKPSADGTIVYLNGGADLLAVTGRVEAEGGKLLIPKTEIAPEMGYYAIFTDTEGNKLGLYAAQ